MSIVTDERLVIKALLLMTLFIGNAYTQASNYLTPAALECVVELPVPGYPPLPWMARMTGEVRVLIDLGERGEMRSMEAFATSPLLALKIKEALKFATFSPRCVDRKIEIVFVYRQAGPESEIPTSDIKFLFPNKFQITSRPPFAVNNP